MDRICTFEGCFDMNFYSVKRRTGGLLAFMVAVCSAFAQTFSVTGGSHVPLLADNNTAGRIQVYLVYGMDNVQINYTSASTSHQWYRYRTRALDDSEPVSSTQNGTTSFVTNPQDGYGYYVMENENIGMNYFVWIIDYLKYECLIQSMRISPDMDECIGISFDGEADIPDMFYNIPSGAQTRLNR